jgi:diguanylate cyclase (GGDEF)-like protein
LTPGEDAIADAPQAPGQAGAREQVNVGVVLCDAAGNVLHVDDAAAAIMGLEAQTTSAVRLQTWLEFENSLLNDDGGPLAAGQSPLRQIAKSGKPLRDHVVVVPDAEGKPSRWLQITAEQLHAGDDGAITGIVLILIDVTPMQLSAAASGLLVAAAAPSDQGALKVHLRVLINDHLLNQQKFTVAALGIDRFKNVHDSLGHALTEQLEHLVVGRLLRDLREGDTVTRTGEGDFVVLLAETGEPTQVSRAIDRVKTAFDRRWEVAGREVFLTPSIGIAICPDNGTDGDGLVRNAAKAMRLAQAAGGNTWRFFKESSDSGGSERLGLESDLHRALEMGHFILDFQPQIDSYSGSVVGVEALLRWRDPERGIIPPNDFIPLAEETGLMLPIGAWVLDAACRQAAEWNGGGGNDVRMAVNISPRQFEQQDIVGLVRRSLHETDLPAHLLEIEITESMAIQNPDHTIALLKGLKELGVRVALDDFGTGYSSLSHLARLPIDTVKIDRSFVMNLEEAREHIVVATSVIALGHRLGLTVVAEGVETHEQAAFLGNESCDLLQGYLFSRPVSAEKCADLLGGDSAFAGLLEESAMRLAKLIGSGGFGKQ